ncbi:MAG: pyridoxal phosphate-dependent aminotransferase [candidate division FCPU426 bacterium]
MPKLSKRALSIQASPTLAITAKANQMKAEGKDVVGFGAGEPDMDTPDFIKNAGIEAIQKGFTKYTASAGIMDLRKAIAEKLGRENSIAVEASQVVVSNGAKHSIANVCLALLDEGDEVIIPAPYWVSYPEIVKMAGGKPVILETDEDNGFRVPPKMLERAIGDKTKLVILCSPSNPTGAMYDREQLSELAAVLEKKDVFVLSDEIYEKLVYGGAKHVSIASLSPAMLAKTITVNGMSKAYSMTGWRIGYAAGPAAVMKAIDNIQSHGASNPASMSQKAALAAIRGDGADVERMRVEFEKRRDLMIAGLNAIEGISCLKPDGAFYAFPNVSRHFGKSFGGKPISNSTDFAAQLLEAEQVAVVPGADFGSPDHIRLSYATDLASIQKGLDRLKSFCSKLEAAPAAAAD